jgi:hypothetical protein
MEGVGLKKSMNNGGSRIEKINIDFFNPTPSIIHLFFQSYSLHYLFIFSILLPPLYIYFNQCIMEGVGLKKSMYNGGSRIEKINV